MGFLNGGTWSLGLESACKLLTPDRTSSDRDHSGAGRLVSAWRDSTASFSRCITLAALSGSFEPEQRYRRDSLLSIRTKLLRDATYGDVLRACPASESTGSAFYYRAAYTATERLGAAGFSRFWRRRCC